MVCKLGVMSKKVPAIEKLASWMKASSDRKWPHLARVLGVTATTVYRWSSGSYVPAPQFRLALQDLTKGEVLADDWLTDEEFKEAYAFSRSRRRRYAERGIEL